MEIREYKIYNETEILSVCLGRLDRIQEFGCCGFMKI